jgi:ribosome biogenesis GTPase
LRSVLLSLGADDQVVDALEILPGTPGRIVRVERSYVAHVGPAGSVHLSVPRNLPLIPCVGDWATAQDGAVNAVLPRRSLVGRAEAGGTTRQQALAANVTHVLVAVPASAPVALGRLERLLTLVWSSGATPVVVVTKADVGSVDTAQLESAAPGVEVMTCSAVTGDGLEALRVLAGPGSTMAVLGASGAGKSSLVNALAGAEVMPTQDVRSDGRGRHTTVARQLVQLPTGGVVIDTPGLRAVALWAGADDGLERAFSDVEDLAPDCRFADCAHLSEPGCAVQMAIDAGVLDARRVESWRKLGRELTRQANRQDALARRQAGLAWRASHRPTRPPRP